jgi:DNA helicase-2/ATP-dependent DNA helicase PcrA
MKTQPATTLRGEPEHTLNPQQRAAVLSPARQLLVLAGAGTGKTTVLTHRVAHLVCSGVKPERILLLSFTRKAAFSLLNRVEALCGLHWRKFRGGTFHRIGLELLWACRSTAGMADRFRFLSTSRARGLLLEQLPGPLRDPGKAAAILRRFQIARSRAIAVEFAADEDSELIQKAFSDFEVAKRLQGLIGYDDLLWLPVQLLRQRNPAALAMAQSLDHILVDEYQDCSRLQMDFVRLLVAEGASVTAVGDDAQAIYGWRGAAAEGVHAFIRDFPQAEVLKVELNYRSTPEILDLANRSLLWEGAVQEAAVAPPFNKKLQPTRPGGAQPKVIKVVNFKEQALEMGRLIEKMSLKREYSDVAILYRSRFISLEIQFALSHAQIPFTLLGESVPFFQNPHIRLVRELLYRALAGEPAPVVNSPAGWTGTVDRDASYRAVLETVGISAGDAITAILSSPYGEHLRRSSQGENRQYEDLRMLATFAGTRQPVESFLNRTAPAAVGGGVHPPPPSVVLSTIHQAKGLEFPVVILPALAEGFFPIKQALGDEEKLREESRLFHVAVTRAMDELYFFVPGSFESTSGQSRPLEPSRWLPDSKGG